MPSNVQERVPAGGERDFFEAHKNTLALDVSEAQVHAAGIAPLRVPVENHVLHARHDALHEPLRQARHVRQVILRAGTINTAVEYQE